MGPAAHRGYFGRIAAQIGAQFDEATQVICQKFRLLWAP